LDFENRLSEVKGSYHVLRVAHNCMETRLKTVEQKKETLEKENELQKKSIVFKKKINFNINLINLICKNSLNYFIFLGRVEGRK
jgi:hypothetical protein